MNIYQFLGSRLNNNDPEGSSVHMYEPFFNLEISRINYIFELKSIIIVFFFNRDALNNINIWHVIAHTIYN